MTKNSKNSLVLITTSFPISADGSEAAGSFVADLAVQLAKFMKIKVVAPGGKERIEKLSDNLEIYRFRIGKKPLSQLSIMNPLHVLLIIRTLFSLRKMSLLTVADDQVNHVLALWVLPSGWAARIINKKFGIPYSVWALGSDIWSLGKTPVVNRILKNVSENALNCYADGLQLAADAKKITGCEYSFLPSTRNFSPSQEKNLKAKPPYQLLFLGRWHINKGVDLLLDALDLLGDEDWSRIELLEIQGGGPLDALVRIRVASLVAQNRPVLVGGFLDKAEAEAAIARADWMLIPSRIESIPVIFSDAMKMRRPVVCTPVGDLPQLIDQDNVGICAQALDALSIANALRAALSSNVADFAPALAQAAQRFDMQAGVVKPLLQSINGAHYSAHDVPSL